MSSRRNKKDLKKKKSKKKALQAKKQVVQKSINSKKYWFVLLGILVYSFMCYSPSLKNEFVNWDDDRNFVENELITSLNETNFWENTREIFRSDVIGGYNPLTIWTFLLEQKFIGQDKPMYWHLNNILLHLLACIFVFWIGVRLGLNLLATSFLTLLFAVHPMRVESVAWVTERKDVLYGALYLAAIYQYIKAKQRGFTKKDYLIIAVCFLLSLLSKIQAVILPLSLILVDYYLSKDALIKFKSIIAKWPYFLASLAIGLLGIYFLKDQGSIDDQEYSGISRLFIGSYSLTVYYIKSIIPYRLSPLYPYPSSLNWSFYVSFISVIATAVALWYSYIKKWRHHFFGLGFFVVNIILLLQILGAGQGFLADRFTYIAYFGLFYIMAFWFNKLQKNRKFNIAAQIAAGLAILVFSVMCYNQNKIWENSATLWTHVLKYYKNTTLPWGNRANYYRDNGEVQKALYDYSQVIKLKPDRPEAYNSRARLYFNYSNRDSLLKALDNYNRAIALKSNDVEYIVNRGATYAKLGDTQNAMKNLNQAEQVDPSFANIYLNRSVIFSMAQDWPKALQDVNKYLELKPANADMWYEKSRLHMVLGQTEQSLEASARAIRMQPNRGLYHFERGRALFYFNKIAEAKASIRKAQSLGYNGDPAFAQQVLNSQ